MKKVNKQILSAFLALLLFVSSCPAGAFATENDLGADSITEMAQTTQPAETEPAETAPTVAEDAQSQDTDVTAEVVCEVCGALPCICEENEDVTKPEKDPAIGRIATITSIFPILWKDPTTGAASNQVSPLYSTMPRYVKIVDVYQFSETVKLYKLDAADGYTWPQEYNDYRYMESTKLTLVNVCDICGGYGCTAVHTYCDVCQKYDCGLTHEPVETEPTEPEETEPTGPDETEPTDPEETEPTEPENSCACCENCTGAEDCPCKCGDCDFCENEIPQVKDEATGITVYAEAFPEDVTLSVAPADVSNQLTQFGISEEKKVFGFDISLIETDNVDYQPETGAVVKIPVSVPVGTKIGILHTHNGNTTYVGMTEVLADGTIEFYTDGFSEFAGFTVDFHYNSIDFSIGGLTSIKLSDLFVALGIDRNAADAVSVVFSDPTLVAVSTIEGDWLLTSLEAFQTEETLVITFANGEIIIIDVTDAQHNSANDPVNTGTSSGSTGYRIFSAVSGINAAWSVLKGHHKITVNLYGTDGSLIDYSVFVEHPSAGGWLSFSSSSYWFKVGDYDFGSGNPSREDRDTIKMGGMGYGGYYNAYYGEYRGQRENSINIHMYSTDVWYDANYCDINQVSKFANYAGEVGNRTVIVYAYNANTGNYYEVGRNTVSFPTFESISADDLIVTPYKGWYVANKTASGSTYNVYLSPYTYTVAYNGNGATGGSTANSTHYYGAEKALTTNGYSRTGYYFAGWSTAANGSVQYADGAKVINLSATNGATVTLYAVWTPIYKVTLDNQGATSAGTTAYWYIYNTTKVVSGETVYYWTNQACTTPLSGYTISTPTRTGYTFGGYYTGKNGTGTQYVNASGTCVNNLYSAVAADSTLYAYWTPKTDASYTIQCYISGTSTLLHTQTVTAQAYGNEITVSAPAIAGYTATTASGKVTAGYSGNVVTFYYTANSKKVSYQYAGHIPASATSLPAASFKNYNDIVTVAAAPTANGYTFSGWTTSDVTISGGQFTMPDKAVTLTGTWTLVSYTATLVYDNGQNNGSVTYTIEEAITLPTLTRDGYTHSGWKVTSANGNWNVGDGYTGSTPLGKYGNVSFTAQWEVIDYDLSYDLGGGTLEQPNPDSYNINSNTITLNNPSKTGYLFDGWVGSNGTTAQTTVTIEKGSMDERHYTAIWTPISYTIIYNGNGSTSGSMDPQTFVYDTEQALSPNAFAREFTVSFDANGGQPLESAVASSAFSGWTKPTRAANSYADGEQVINLTATHNEEITLYAIWTPGAITLPQPSNNALPFLGWFTAPEGGEKIGNAGDSYAPDGDVTIYAQWGNPFYTITFDTNGGSAIAPISLAAGEAIPTITPPVKNGAKFVGWSPALPATMPAEHITVVAMWEYEETLTISVDGQKNETFLFRVKDTAGNVNIIVSVQGGKSVTIGGLYHGVYNIEELGSWSWTCATPAAGQVTLKADDNVADNKITFTKSGSSCWLRGENHN